MLPYGAGCGKHHSYLRDSGFTALAAMGAAGTVDVLQLTFDRRFAYTPDSTGKFWAPKGLSRPPPASPLRP
jgi:hypothetical protein